MRQRRPPGLFEPGTKDGRGHDPVLHVQSTEWDCSPILRARRTEGAADPAALPVFELRISADRLGGHGEEHGTEREAVISLRHEVGGGLTVLPPSSWPSPTALMRKQALITTDTRTRQHECAGYVTTGCIGIVLRTHWNLPRCAVYLSAGATLHRRVVVLLL